MAQNNRSDDIRTNWKCLAACTLVSMCPFQYGIDFGLIGGLQAMVGFLKVFGHPDPDSPIGYNISPGRQQLISSLMTLGAFLISLVVGPIAGLLGRRSSIWLGGLLISVGTILMMVTTSIGGLYAGRLILGLGNGCFMTFSQLYLQECSPAKYRGLVLSCFMFWTSIGTLIGTIVDNFTAPILGKNSYLIPLGLIYIVPVLVAFGLLFIPESPRWLLYRGETEKARKALLWLRPYADQVEPEIDGILAAINAERDLSRTVSWFDMFKNPVDRRRTLLSVAAVSLQAASGAMYMIAYGTYFFEMAHVGSPFANSCALVAVGVVAIVINSFIVTRYGRRRPMLLSGLLLCGFTQLITAAIYQAHPLQESTSKAIVGVSVIYICGYNGMISTYSWVMGGELASQRLRSYTFGLAAAVGFLGAWLATFTAPYFINPDALNWGPKYGYIWFPSCMVAALFVFFFMPEVKDRTLEEINEMFEMRIPARKFASYRCTGLDRQDSKAPSITEGTREIIFTDPKAVAETTISIA
ncbi:MAG: hypothetical protein M1820_010401 [Bogoriella megaspora]|nr:MAG: hypothetical protein M1820_010401 [Bogoriella megaspora]